MASHDGAGVRSGGVAGIGQLPVFALPAAGGEEVRSWDFKGRRPLVVWLAGAAPPEQALTEAAARLPAIHAEGAALLVIVRAPLADAEALRRRTGIPAPVLADADGRIHDRLGASRPTLFVTDRNGTIYWRAVAPDARPDLDEALSWLGYIGILEPECGTCVPAWPME